MVAWRIADGTEPIPPLPPGWNVIAGQFELVPALAPDHAALLEVVRAARNVSDRRTLESDGFWVSQKEMNALDQALEALRAVR